MCDSENKTDYRLENATTLVDFLQTQIDDQVFPWLTKSNVKKYRFLVYMVIFFTCMGSTIEIIGLNISLCPNKLHDRPRQQQRY